MKHSIALVAVVVAGLQAGLWAAKTKEISVTDDFARVEQFDKAQELARKRKTALAVYVLPKELEYWDPNCPKCRAEINGRASAISRAVTSPAARSMVKVVVYDGETRPESLSKLAINGHGVYFADTEMVLLGKVAEGKTLDDNMPRVAGAVSELVAWKNTAPAKIDTAVKGSISGRLAEALKALDQIEQIDRRAADAIAKNWAETPEASKVEVPATVKGKFFAEALDAARKQIAENGAKLVTEARELLEKGQLAKARSTVGPVAASKADLACVADAKALLEEIEKKGKP